MTNIFSNLLGGGYFPKELPPTFTTRSFGECAKRFESKRCKLDEPDKSWRQYEIHNLARAGTLRRELAIVNPVSYWRVARKIADEWAVIHQAAEQSPISLTKPVTGLPRSLPWGRDIHSARARVRAQGRFILRADISNFYGSVYTHTIPWALHTKVATRHALREKDKNKPSLLGDDLDTLFRAMQDGQSVGLPVGPDASLLIAEIILSSIDEKVLSDCSNRGFRFIDDYELVFDSEWEALEARNKLQSALADYRLTLNPLKTRIEKLPVSLDDGWSRELWRIIERKSVLRKTDIVNFFDRAFDVATHYPAGGVLKFALGKLCKKAFADDAAEIAQNLVLQCGRVEAGCLPFVLAVLLRRENPDGAWKATLSNALHSIISEHAPQRHSSEVAWALWGALALKTDVSKEAAKQVLEMEDSVSSLLLFQAHRTKQLAGLDAEFKKWKSVLGQDDLAGSRWLLAYELARIGYTLDATGKNYVSRDERFGFLLKEKVAFFDESRLGVPEGLIPISEDEDSEDDEDDESDDDEEYSLGGFWDEWDDWNDGDEDDE